MSSSSSLIKTAIGELQDAVAAVRMVVDYRAQDDASILVLMMALEGAASKLITALRAK